MIKNKTFSIILFALLFSACHYSNKWTTVSNNNEFSAEVPSWMNKTDDLLSGAPLQYCNRFRSVYFIVIKDKQDTLPPFTEYAANNISVLKNAMQKAQVTDSTVTELGGLKGIHSEVMGNMGKEKIFYSHYSLEGKKGYNYQVCIWTRGEERKLRYKDDINRMLESFKAL